VVANFGRKTYFFTTGSDRTQTLDLRIMRRVFNHCASAAGIVIDKLFSQFTAAAARFKASTL
jgi:hypothetical protein